MSKTLKNYKIPLPYLLTIHNTYVSVTSDYISSDYLYSRTSHISGEPKNKQDIRKRNSRIIQIGHSCDWKTFITLTFSPDYYWDNLDEIQKQFRAFIKSLYYFIGEFKYLAVLEYGELSGRVHYHMLTTIDYQNDIFEYYHREDRKVCKLYRWGFSDVKEVNNNDCNAVFYLAKYLTKGDGLRTPIGKREVFSSRGLNKIKRVVTYDKNSYIDNMRKYSIINKTTIYVKKKESKNVEYFSKKR